MFDNILLSVDEMYKADALAAASVPSLDLMEAAGAAITAEIQNRWPSRPVAVLAGPGNNGGDGFVAARLLAADGWPVRLALLGKKENLKGDAAVNATAWDGEIEELSPAYLEGHPLVVDGLFGAGLTRPLDGPALTCVKRINDEGLDCLAVDIPSGVHGDSGEILGGEGGAAQASVTVTFFRAKPGHYLMPGRRRCGDLIVADIGIPRTVLDDINPATRLNGPDLWQSGFPWPDAEDHKYSRGHAVIAGGAAMTRAAPRAGEILFTSGTTAGINLVAHSWGDAELSAGDEILLTVMEHHSNIVPWQQLAERTGAQVRWVDIDDQGQLDMESLR